MNIKSDADGFTKLTGNGRCGRAPAPAPETKPGRRLRQKSRLNSIKNYSIDKQLERDYVRETNKLEESDRFRILIRGCFQQFEIN